MAAAAVLDLKGRGRVKRVNMRHHAKFLATGQTIAVIYSCPPPKKMGVLPEKGGELGPHLT